MVVPSYQPPMSAPPALGLLTEKLRTLLNSTLEGTRAVLLWWRNVGEHPRAKWRCSWEHHGFSEKSSIDAIYLSRWTA